jgi:glycosyltransferase involved in cell wall biosynthesis
MAVELVPVAVVIPTGNRAVVLRRTLESLAAQSFQPDRIVLVDASEDETTRSLCVERTVFGLASEVIWRAAQIRGAASQRNQGVRECRHAVIGFFDDDILFEPECVARLWHALQSDVGLGGVNTMIVTICCL